MSYLYGDSTPSTLEVNFIEFLRDAVDCCVQVLLADQRIAEGAARVRALDASTAAEIARLQRVGALVPKAFEGTPVGDAASPTARCVAEIVRTAAEVVSAASAAASSTLQAAVTRRDADAALEREVFVKALEALLIKHDLPDMTSDSDVTLVAGGRYACRVLLTTPFGLDAMMATEVPAGHLLERVVRIDRLAERLDVQVPEIAGWLHKEVKLRTQHLEKHHLCAFARGPAGTRLALRLAPDGTGPGYDVTFGGDDGESVRLVRVDEQGKREEPFEAKDSDVPKLVALRDKIGGAVAELGRHRTKIVDAKLEGEALLGHPKPSLLVERLIGVLLPETRQISARSHSPGELVLRRSLGGDRREEIFLSKRDLQAKLEGLDERHRGLFDALLRDGAAPARVEPPPAPSARTEPAAPASEGSGPSVFKKTLAPQPMSAITAAPAPSPTIPVAPSASPTISNAPAPSPSRLPTPSYGIPSLAAQSQSAPPAPPPAAGKPSSIAEALRATPSTDEAPTIKTTAPPDDASTLKTVPTGDPSARKTAPLELRTGEKRPASALDRPPPAAPAPRSAVAGEIGGAPEEKKRPEPSGPITAT
jgi:hypothetical protein